MCLLQLFWKYSVGLLEIFLWIMSSCPPRLAFINETLLFIYRDGWLSPWQQKELLFHKFWNVLESYQQKDLSPQLFCNFHFWKTFTEKRYNLFSHWNRDWERLSRFINMAKHISWHPPTFNSWPLLCDTQIKFGYSNWGLNREVRFSISIWEVRTKNRFKFWTTKPNLDSWAKCLTWFDCKLQLPFPWSCSYWKIKNFILCKDTSRMMQLNNIMKR